MRVQRVTIYIKAVANIDVKYAKVSVRTLLGWLGGEKWTTSVRNKINLTYQNIATTFGH